MDQWPLTMELCFHHVPTNFESDVVFPCSTAWFPTWTPAQVFDVDLLLLHARRLPDQTGVVVGIAVGGTHRVLVVATAVDVAYTPAGREKEQVWLKRGVETSHAAWRSVTLTTRPPSPRRTRRRTCRCCTL